MPRRTPDTEATHCCKVGRVGVRYELDGLDERLVQKWSTEGAERASLRELRRYVNREILRAVLADTDAPTIDGEDENLLRLLTDDVGENRRLEAVRRLERHGVDADTVQRDFVSHQTVHTHLRDCLGASPEADRSDADRLESARSTVFALQNRTETVTESTIDQLRRNDVVDLEEFAVIVNIQVICDECGRATDVGSLLADGGCVCQS